MHPQLKHQHIWLCKAFAIYISVKEMLIISYNTTLLRTLLSTNQNLCYIMQDIECILATQSIDKFLKHLSYSYDTDVPPKPNWCSSHILSHPFSFVSHVPICLCKVMSLFWPGISECHTVAMCMQQIVCQERNLATYTQTRHCVE